MPISPAQWEAAVAEQLNAISSAVLAFLKANDMAYSADEVAKELDLDGDAVYGALVELCYEGVVDGGEVNSVVYFIYRRYDDR
jgi:hypothetical protein